jgi:hypothetical protein
MSTKKPSPKTAAKSGEKPEADGKASPQSEVAKKLYEKLHGKDAQAKGGPPGPGAPGKAKGFDPKQFKGGGKPGGGATGMMRRTQSRGGGSAGGGGGGGGSAGA